MLPSSSHKPVDHVPSLQQTCPRKAPGACFRPLASFLSLPCGSPCAACCADGVTSTSHATVHTSPYGGDRARTRGDFEAVGCQTRGGTSPNPPLRGTSCTVLMGSLGSLRGSVADGLRFEGEYQTRCARGARAVHARCGYWGCSIDPFIQSQSGGMVTPQSPAGTICNSSPRRPSPGEVVQIPDAVRTRCARGADTPPEGGWSYPHVGECNPSRGLVGRTRPSLCSTDRQPCCSSQTERRLSYH